MSELDTDLSKLTIDKSRKKQSGGAMTRYVTLLILAAIFGGGGYYAYARFSSAIPVQTATPVRETGTVKTSEIALKGTGYVIARDVYDIASKIVGRVEEIFVERGDIVQAGDTIILVEDDEYVAQIEMTEARVAIAQANLDQLRAGSRPQEIALAQADAASAEASAIQARADEKRAADLLEDEVTTPQEIERARTNRIVAESNLRIKKEMARLAELGPRVEEIQMAEAQLEEAEANLEFSKTQLSFTVITSPITGTILEKVAKKGEMVTNSNFGGGRGARSSVASLADLTDLQVELDITEDDLPRVRMDQRCEIRVDGFPEERIEGIVDEIAPRADRQKATVQVKVKILDPPDFLRPEINANVTFMEEASVEADSESSEDDGSLWVPTAAIVLGSDGPAVYIAFDGRATERSVKVGRDGSLGTEITEGLLGDEQIITSPLDQISDGAAVKPAQ
jgi:HlyD family secretion protein